MGDPYVHTVGELFDLDEHCVKVGVDYDSVSLDLGVCQVRLSQAAAEEFAQLFSRACWEAGAQQGRMAEEVSGD